MFKSARFAVATALFAALAAPVVAQDAATVVARVGTAEITLGQAIALRTQLPAQFAQVPDETLFPALIDQLIELELLNQFKRDSLSLAERMMLLNENRNFIANAALAEAAANAVTDESVATAYEAFAAEFAQGEPVTEYHAAHILVRSEEEMAQVTAALAEGRDFGEVAAEFSMDGSAQQGGDLGWFAAGVMIPDFQAAVEALEPGQVSEPLQTRFGFHVIKLFETRAQAVPELATVRDDLVANIQREAARALITGLREASQVENFADQIDPTQLSNTALLDE
ncbi:MAG: peptidylprolyl isomerase [Paracoccaceae bacterium]